MKDESLHTITIVKNVLKKYGPECLGWEPAVIQKSMFDDFGSAKLNVYKAIAGLSVLENDRFWSDWHTFQFLCQPFNNLMPSVHTAKELSVAQMMVAVDTANSLRQSLGKASYVPVFSEEVAKYVAAVSLNQGIWFLPEPLGFASNYASKTMVVCQDCGNEEFLDDEEDQICVVCTGKYDSTRLSSFSHDEQRIKKGFGVNTKIVTKHSTLGVEKTLQSLLVSTKANLDENNPDHVCAARLFTAIRYFMERKQESKNESA